MSYAAYRQSEGLPCARRQNHLGGINKGINAEEKVVNFVTRRIEFFQLNQVVAREDSKPRPQDYDSRVEGYQGRTSPDIFPHLVH